ncbi:MAG: Lrp/AsnC family transcriptional regulator [Thermoplasmata archaeon]
MPRAGGVTIDKKNKGFAEGYSDRFLPIFHAMVLSCESAIGRSSYQSVSSIVPELIDNLEIALPKDILRNASKKTSIEERAHMLSDFLMSLGQFGELEFSSDGKDIYCLEVSDCQFARSGIHRRFRAGNNVCPMALLFAAFLTRATDESQFISVSPSIFERYSSLTRMCLAESDDESSTSSVIQESVREYALDRIDVEILRIIQGNARLSNVDIANALRTSEATVRRRIQALVDRGIIKGFMAKIDHGQLRRKVRLHLALEVSSDKADDVVEALLSRPETCSLYRSLGQYNLICELLMNDMASVQSFIDEISSMEGVKKTNSMIATSALKPCPWYD